MGDNSYEIFFTVTMVSYMGDNSCFLFSFRFEWKFKFADRKLLSVTPDYGIIQPNENQVRLFRCLSISLSAVMFIRRNCITGVKVSMLTSSAV